MSRVFGQMNKDEQQLYNIYQGRLKDDLCTPAEKEDAKRKIEILEQKGMMGETIARINAFEERLSVMELIKGRGKQAFTKAMFEEMKADIATHTASLIVAAQRIDTVLNELDTNRTEISGLQADHLKKLEEDEIRAATLTRIERNILEMRERNDGKFKTLEASNDETSKAITDVIANAVDEAKTAIMAEAQTAAIEAVSALVGDTDA